MGQETGIQWCHHSWSPWGGCSKVSCGCAHCYVEPLIGRFSKGNWGPQGGRWFFSESHWRKPFQWDKAAAKAGERRRVFPSMCDIFEDRDDLVETRRRFFGQIAETPNLDWLILTKRPEVAAEWLGILVRRTLDILTEHSRRRGLSETDEPLYRALDTTGCFPNLWLGVSCEDQQRADERIPYLLQTPAAVRFVSAEPLLSAVDFTQVAAGPLCPQRPAHRVDVLRGGTWNLGLGFTNHGDMPATVDQIIVGGESGRGARPCDLAWVRSIVKQCQTAGTSVFVKQLGSRPTGYWLDPLAPGDGICYAPGPERDYWKLTDKKGGDTSGWPADLRVRNFPKAKGLIHA